MWRSAARSSRPATWTIAKATSNVSPLGRSQTVLRQGIQPPSAVGHPAKTNYGNGEDKIPRAKLDSSAMLWPIVRLGCRKSASRPMAWPPMTRLAFLRRRSLLRTSAMLRADGLGRLLDRNGQPDQSRTESLDGFAENRQRGLGTKVRVVHADIAQNGRRHECRQQIGIPSHAPPTDTGAFGRTGSERRILMTACTQMSVARCSRRIPSPWCRHSSPTRCIAPRTGPSKIHASGLPERNGP